jgi:hypothetical protein
MDFGVLQYSYFSGGKIGKIGKIRILVYVWWQCKWSVGVDMGVGVGMVSSKCTIKRPSLKLITIITPTPTNLLFIAFANIWFL